MEPVEELVARDQIRQLAERYSLAVDGKDVEGVVALFTEDVDCGPFGTGHEGIRNRYDTDLRKYHCTMHFVGNHVIDFDDDDHAHGVVYLRAYHHVLEPEHWFDVSAAYWDTYERVGGEWRFRQRQPRAWFHQSFGHPEQPSVRQHVGGLQMPEAFPTWSQFWEQPPRH